MSRPPHPLLLPLPDPEVVADDTPAVQAVLKADTRRLKLLDEEKRLQARLEKGDDSVGDRLEKVKQPIGCRSPSKSPSLIPKRSVGRDLEEERVTSNDHISDCRLFYSPRSRT